MTRDLLFFDPDCRRPARRLEHGMWSFLTFVTAVEMLRQATAAPPGFLAALSKRDRTGREALALIRAMKSRQTEIYAEFLRLVEELRIASEWKAGQQERAKIIAPRHLMRELRRRADFRRMTDPLPEELAPYGALLAQVCVEVPEEFC